jgi:DNA-binding NtrC family response regulator
MPSLRSMPDIIPAIADQLVPRVAAELRRPAPRTTPASFESLARYYWPGNVRELRNAIERALIFHEGGEFRVEPPRADVAAEPPAGALLLDCGLTLEEVERRYLANVLGRSGRHDFAQIARELGISRKTLWDKRRRYGLDS